MRNILNLNQEWLFVKDTADITAQGGDVVSLPHSWNATDGQDGGNDYFRGACLYKKTLKMVLITLSSACFLATGVALVANRFLIFPTFSFLYGGSIFGMTVEFAFSTFVWGLVIFNLIKTISIAVLTMLLYKRLSNLIKRF